METLIHVHCTHTIQQKKPTYCLVTFLKYYIYFTITYPQNLPHNQIRILQEWERPAKKDWNRRPTSFFCWDNIWAKGPALSSLETAFVRYLMTFDASQSGVILSSMKGAWRAACEIWLL